MAIISLQQASSYAQAAGFSGQSLATILAIAQAESGLDTTATNTNADSHTFPDGHTGPSEDRGVLQINNYWQPQVTNAQAFNPATAFIAGYAISTKGTNFAPWSTYQSGAYKRYLPVSTSVTRLLPNAIQFSEFQDNYHGTCGETALAAALVCATPPIETKAQAISLMLSLTQQMIHLGWASSSGATNTQHLYDEAKKRGFTPAPGFVSFQQPLDPATLHPYLLANAGVFPIVLEIANGQALHGDEVGLHYHFICVVGLDPSGYQCIDGDNPSAGLVTYSWATLEAAIPCGLLGIEMQKGKSMLPAGWKDTGSELVDPAGGLVPEPFRSYLLEQGWNAQDYVEGAVERVALVEVGDPARGGGEVLYFRWSALGAPSGKGAYKLYAGSEVRSARSLLTQAQAEIAQLKQELAAKAPVVPAPVDPSVKNALAATLQLLQPQATLSAEIQTALATLK